MIAVASINSTRQSAKTQHVTQATYRLSKESRMSEQDSQQKIPFSQEAEEAVLGAILLDPDSYLKAALIIDAKCFFRPVNQIIFNGITALHESRIPIDTISLCHWLKSQNKLEQIGGSIYVDQLMGNVPASWNIESYANIVRQKYVQREMAKTLII